MFHVDELKTQRRKKIFISKKEEYLPQKDDVIKNVYPKHTKFKTLEKFFHTSCYLYIFMTV